MSKDRIRTLTEVATATSLRRHPEERLTTDVMQAILDAPMAACGHLVGFLPPNHPDPAACVQQRQLHVAELLRGLGAPPR